ICVNQNIHVLEKYFRKEEWPEALKGKPHVLLVSEYDPISKYKIKNIANKFEYRAPILTIPYLTEFKDALNDGDVKGFFYRNQSIQKGHQNYLFMHEIRRAASVILNESGVNVLTKKIERGAS